MVPLPSDVPPSKKATVPLGVPEFVATVAVRVTAWPVVAGFGEGTSDVVVVAADGELTVSVRAVEVDVLKLPSPLYCEVMLCVPAVIEVS
jgi:hypothetical protein